MAMSRLMWAMALAGAVTLGACSSAPPPPVPSVVASPGNGKSVAQFQTEDSTCRDYAWRHIGYRTPRQVADESRAAGAALGTALGAVAGTLLGAASDDPATGAAFGAASGLLLASAISAGVAQAAGDTTQRSYDLSYQQCMSASRNSDPSIPYSRQVDAHATSLGNPDPADLPY
jgi:uncharacterized protein YcfJ